MCLCVSPPEEHSFSVLSDESEGTFSDSVDNSISTALIRLGSEFQRLSVIGEKSPAPGEDMNLSAQAR